MIYAEIKPLLKQPAKYADKNFVQIVAISGIKPATTAIRNFMCKKCVSKFARFQTKPRYKQSTPKWMTYQDFCHIFSNRVRGLSMDHIIPLNHPKVCGLNVPQNIQLITKEENDLKDNFFDGTYENDSWKNRGISS